VPGRDGDQGSRRIVGSGNQTAGTRSRQDNSASTRASILSVLHVNGASPLTFLASAPFVQEFASIYAIRDGLVAEAQLFFGWARAREAARLPSS
jgi:hypothetical protein